VFEEFFPRMFGNPRMCSYSERDCKYCSPPRPLSHVHLKLLFPKSTPVIPSSISFSIRFILSTSFVLRLPRSPNRHHLIKTSIPNDFRQPYDHALEILRGTPSSNVTVLKPPPPLPPETSSVKRPENAPVVPSLRLCNKSTRIILPW
jgi:hypothetical protein